MWDNIQIIWTRMHSQLQSSNNLQPPPSSFVSLCLHAFISPSVPRLPPSSRLLGAFTTDPPERGLMRANDGNACCCFPFINGATLAQPTRRLILGSLSAAAPLLPPSFPTSLGLLPFTPPPPLSSLKWSEFPSFSSIHTYLPCLSPRFISPPPPPLWILTC